MKISYLLSSVLNLFYPSLCMGCEDDEVDETEMLCINCFQNLAYTGFENIKGNMSEKLFWGRIDIRFGCSIFYFIQGSPIQQIIHKIKYKNEEALGIYMGRLMGIKLKDCLQQHEIDFCIPMPLHYKKEFKRGYNQATLLCKGIEQECAIAFDERIIIREENTSTQTKKSRIERWDNVGHVFSILDKHKIKGKNILIIDDVITTGASTEACAQAFLNRGAKSVSICGLAQTL